MLLQLWIHCAFRQHKAVNPLLQGQQQTGINLGVGLGQRTERCQFIGCDKTFGGGNAITQLLQLLAIPAQRTVDSGVDMIIQREQRFLRVRLAFGISGNCN